MESAGISDPVAGEAFPAIGPGVDGTRDQTTYPMAANHLFKRGRDESPRTRKLIGLLALLLFSPCQGQSQPYRFSTLAGSSGLSGTIDGLSELARFAGPWRSPLMLLAKSMSLTWETTRSGKSHPSARITL